MTGGELPKKDGSASYYLERTLELEWHIGAGRGESGFLSAPRARAGRRRTKPPAPEPSSASTPSLYRLSWAEVPNKVGSGGADGSMAAVGQGHLYV